MKKSKLVCILGLASLFSLSGCNIIIGCQHQYGPWVTIYEATCNERGLKMKTCKLCGDEVEKSIRVDTKNGHDWQPYPELDKEGSCTVQSITGSVICSYCNATKKGEKGELAEHQWQEAATQPTDVKYKEPTCYAKGTVLEECKVCKETRDAEVDALGHNATVTNKSGGVGTLKCSRCSESFGYELDITGATGWHSATEFTTTTAPNNASIWNIKDKVPAGSYDVQIEAMMKFSSYGPKKYYNMAKSYLQVDGDSDNNIVVGNADKSTQSAYRYFAKVDDKEYNPMTKKSWQELGIEAQQDNAGVGTYGHANLVEFINGIEIGGDSSTFSLCHGNIGFPLVISKVRLIPHQHENKEETVTGENGHVAYKINKCSCGYRKITINATDGALATGAENSSSFAGTMKLKTNNSSISYLFKTAENIVGDLYVVGREDTYPSNKDQSPYKGKWAINETNVDYKNTTKKCGEIFGTAEDPDNAGFSPEGNLLVNEVSLKKNEPIALKYTRTGSYNICMNKIVIEGKVAEHIHAYSRDASKDIAATCTTGKQECSVCDCGETTFKDTDELAEHDWYTYQTVKATCTENGKYIQKCHNCTATQELVIPAGHTYKTSTPSGAAYTIQKCTGCGDTTVTWNLNGDMIEDLVEDQYEVSELSPISGSSLYKFDVEGRKVTLSYLFDGTVDKEVDFFFVAATKVDDVDKAGVYEQNYGHGSDTHQAKFTVTVNGVKVDIAAADAGKTMQDLGLTNTASSVVDGSALTNATKLQFCKITLTPGSNTIEFVNECAEATYPVYISGFGLAYVYKAANA